MHLSFIFARGAFAGVGVSILDGWEKFLRISPFWRELLFIFIVWIISTGGTHDKKHNFRYPLPAFETLVFS